MITGVIGAIAGFSCAITAGLVFFALPSAIDPSLLAVVIPWALAYILIVGSVVALANGVVWYILMQKMGWGAIPWMVLSIIVAFVAPWVILLCIAIFQPASTARTPKANELFICCGIPGIVFMLWILTYQVFRSKALPLNRKFTPTSKLVKPTPDQDAIPSNKTSQRIDFSGFWSGTLFSLLIAMVFALLFGISIYFVFQAEINSPPSSGGFGLNLSRLDTAFYSLLLLVIAVAFTFVIAAVSMLIVVAPKMSTRARKVIATVLFTLLTTILNFIFDMVIFTILFSKFNLI